MKVLQVIPGIAPQYGGAAVSMLDLGRLLRSHGLDTMLMTTNAAPTGRLDVPLNQPIDQNGALVTYYNVWPQNRYSLSLPMAGAMHRTLHHYDVVHIHWLYNFAPLIAAIAARKAGIPYIFQPHGSLDPWIMEKNTLLKKAYLLLAGNIIVKHAAAFLYTSATEQDTSGLNKHKIPSYVVPVGLDWNEYSSPPAQGEFRAQYPELCDKQVVLFLSRLTRQKGLDLLIPAFRNVVREHPRAHLVIAGPDEKQYGMLVRQWVAEAGIEHQVTFTGLLQGRQKLAAYIDSDLFVLPSYMENFGRVVTEALACKCPVIISDQVNIWREITNAQAGIVVKRGVDEIAGSISRLLSDPAYAKQLGENGHQLVRQKFTWDAVLQALIPIYQEVTRRK